MSAWLHVAAQICIDAPDRSGEVRRFRRFDFAAAQQLGERTPG